MKTFKILVSRQVISIDYQEVTIEANNLEEAKRGAIADAEEGYLYDDWDLDEFPAVLYGAEGENE